MRHFVITALAAVLAIIAAMEATAQTVTEVTPSVIGISINPATSRASLRSSGGAIQDGDKITFDLGGASETTFEFDYSGGGAPTVTPGAIPVDMPSDPWGEHAIAREALVQAVNGTASCPVKLAGYSEDSSNYFAIVWKGDGGYGAIVEAHGDAFFVNGDPTDGADKPLAHTGDTRSYVTLIGTGLDSAGIVTLKNVETPAVIISAAKTALDANHLGLKIDLAPNNTTPATAPPTGDYEICIDDVGTGVIIEVVENLINDASFTMNYIGNYAPDPNVDSYPDPVWDTDNQQYPAIPSNQWDVKDKPGYMNDGLDERKDPWPTGDRAWCGITTDDTTMEHKCWQTIPVTITESTMLSLRGLWAGGTRSADTSVTYGVRVLDQNDTLLFQNGPNTTTSEILPPPDFDAEEDKWASFIAMGIAPSGTTELKVLFYIDMASTDAFPGAVLTFDDLLLFEGSLCASPISISQIGPNYGLIDTVEIVTIDGSGFVGGTTEVQLFDGDNLIDATSVTVVNPTQLTAEFDLTGAKMVYHDVIVSNGECMDILPQGYMLALGGSGGLYNGGFEYPILDPVQFPPCEMGVFRYPVADFWTAVQLGTYGNTEVVRNDRLHERTPSCTFEGDRYASAATEGGTLPGTMRHAQTLEVDADKTYTLSGIFASTRFASIKIKLIEGGYNDSLIAEQLVIDTSTPEYASETLPDGWFQDWTFGYVTGTINSNLLTVAWESIATDTGSKAGHADDLILEECTDAIGVTSVNETEIMGGIDGVSLTVNGSGFAAANTPVVILNGRGKVAKATNVDVLSDSELVATFDMTNLVEGWVDVVVGNGCYATLTGDPGAVYVYPGTLQNLNHEEPFEDWWGNDWAPCEIDTGPYWRLHMEYYYWTGTDQHMRRDGISNITAEMGLQCSAANRLFNPLPPLPDEFLVDNGGGTMVDPNPEPGEGHYLTLNLESTEIGQVYQTIKVFKGSEYTVNGWFLPLQAEIANSPDANLVLIDGADPSGTVLASTPIVGETDLGDNPLWVRDWVTGTPTQDYMTILVELNADGSGAQTVHMDNFYMYAPENACAVPFADADEDGDVDQEDFAVFQRCYTGSTGAGIPVEPAYCVCLDVDGDGGVPDGNIDQTDLSRFEDCASGPGVPADPACGG